MVSATGRTAEDLVLDYRRLCRVVRPNPLPYALSRDADDDHVIACADAARAEFLVTGDEDLLVLGTVRSLQIVSTSEALAALT